MFGSIRRSAAGRRTVRATLTSGVIGLLLAGAVVAPQSADAYALSPIDGSYLFDANGWTGTLTVNRAENLDPSIVMSYDELGTSEYLSGTWSPTTGTLTILRPLGNGVSQTYYLYLGNHVPGSPVFGGYFTESDVPGMAYGAYADEFVAPDTVRPSALTPSSLEHAAGSMSKGATVVTSQANVATKSSTLHPLTLQFPDSFIGNYTFNGNGWTGQMLIDWANCPAPADVNVDYDAIGIWESYFTSSWNPATGALTFVRPLSNGITQTYTLYLGTHVPVPSANNGYSSPLRMFGGYFTESDTGSARYAAFATYYPSGIGC